VHSIKARLKDPEHLIEKIIREKQSDPSFEITEETYDRVITDLIGLRALHLFKEDWECIHDWIIESWEVKTKPVVNIREGDNPELVSLFEKKGCEVRKHPFGYRSAHYIVASKPSKKEILAEIQVRTIFEEGWSEIDHLIRYPYVKDNPILEQYLVMFNRLAGSADEMGSYIRYLDTALKTREFEFSKALGELKEKISELEAKIEKMKIEQKDKASLKIGLGHISDITTSMPDFSKIHYNIPDYSKICLSIPDFSELTKRFETYQSRAMEKYKRGGIEQGLQIDTGGGEVANGKPKKNGSEKKDVEEEKRD
jgi:ppGpp synthetase/RelA/SpoT-type nucleotidyltranferase